MNRKDIPVSQLKRSPIRHEQLPLSLVARINYLHQTLEEVYPQPIETWMDGFQRDANPESEVRWWERLAQCYLAYTKAKELSPEQKKVMFRILFSLGVGNRVQEVKADLQRLPDGAEREILALVGPRSQ